VWRDDETDGLVEDAAGTHHFMESNIVDDDLLGHVQYSSDGTMVDDRSYSHLQRQLLSDNRGPSSKGSWRLGKGVLGRTFSRVRFNFGRRFSRRIGVY